MTTPLDKCLEALCKSQLELSQLLDEAANKAARAYRSTDPAEQRRLLTEACDAEYEALGDCEACGGLMQALGLEYDEEDAPEQP